MAHIVQTVLGPVDPGKLDKILHHEHLTSLVPGPWLSGGRPETLADPHDLVVDPNDAVYVKDHVAQAVHALGGLSALGFNAERTKPSKGVDGLEGLVRSASTLSST